MHDAQNITPSVSVAVVQLLPQVINEGAEKGFWKDGRFMHLT